MESYFNKEELKKNLKDFYTITHIRIAVFDENFTEIVDYPEERVELCKYLRTNSSFNQACQACDKAHMEIASKMKEPLIYTCHAGITEIITPIFFGEQIIGYLFFAHILDYPSHSEALKSIEEKIKDYPGDREKIQKCIFQMPLFEDEYLKSCTRILRAVASYLCEARLAYLKYEDMPLKIDSYISSNLSGDLSVKALCREFGLGKTALYNLSAKMYGTGLAQHIKSLRIRKAQDILQEDSEIKIPELAEKVGFTDYNYFIFAFKKAVGMTPNRYRRKQSK
jgi:AraC-like DNA-binding protein